MRPFDRIHQFRMHHIFESQPDFGDYCLFLFVDDSALFAEFTQWVNERCFTQDAEEKSGKNAWHAKFV